MIGLLLSWAGLGCTGQDPTVLQEQVLADLASGFGSFQYAAFAVDSQVMADALRVACSTPSPETLESAQQAWWAARSPWKRAEVIRFGPTIEYPERFGPKLDDWPVNASAVDELLAADTPLNFEDMGTATRGLPVVEYLLWSEAPLVEGRPCETLEGAGEDVADNAAALSAEWQQTWVPWLSDPFDNPGGPWVLSQNGVDEWVNRLAFSAENVRATKLGKPAGDQNGGGLFLDGLESRYSARSTQDARDAIDGVALVWSGLDGALGVRDLLVDDPALVSQLDTLMAQCQQDAAALPEDLEGALVENDRDTLETAQACLLELQVAIQVDLAQALGVSIAFNDNDGD
ncbi:MAG: putative iron-regulated protein [Cognaticolwellia sp.]